ncbi:FkbM family methyltransferase [Falsiroseomonas sp.]|uniref:FkbM family methyltransferase n=1 Tax=Falsiroseomonas sp. TaxID=2870721 RepID=UPI003F71106B
MNAIPLDAAAPGEGSRLARLKSAALRSVCAATRYYFQRVPGRFGKAWIWRHLVERRLLWRSLEIEARSHFGARFAGSFPDSVHSTMYFFGVWEPTITAIYRAALRPGDVVVDIGANVGTHALLAAHLVGPTGRVHAVEASPWIHARLRQNLATNGVTNVHTYNLAATEAPGTVSVYLHDARNLGGTTILPTEAARLGSAHEALVEGLPLGQIVPPAELRAARLIKMDVEGAEWLVAQGMRDVLPLLRDDAEILCEVNPAALRQLGGSLEAFLALFAAAGFRPFEVANRYAADFYIDPPPLELVPLTRRDFELADLVFRKAG